MPSFDLDHDAECTAEVSRPAPEPHSISPLSRAGNQAVQRRLSSAGLQPGVPNGGEPLPIAQRDYFEPRFGASFADVRIHTGQDAEQSAAQVNAHAFTLGSDIVFGRGEYQPDSPDGRQLIAHELAHVIQQSNSGKPQIQRKPIGGMCTADDDQMCTPIPENPLADYPYLVVALDHDSLQMLQDAAYRREHLRRGLPYDGPEGLFFAQGHLKDFLAPGTEYVSREELLTAQLPGLLDAARKHGDPEPFISEIARNEAARQMLEPLRNPLLNVEIPDPDGLEDTPTELTFTVDFKQLQDDHGALALASLDPLSSRGAYLWTLLALNDARQLSEIAELNAKAEWLSENYGQRLDDMAADPHDYVFQEVYAVARELMPELVKSAVNLSSVLMPGNKDQTQLVAKISGSLQSLSARANKAMDAMNESRSLDKMPDRTSGEIYEDNAYVIRKAASEAWDKGGLSYFAWFGNKLGLGANKIFHTAGNLASGGYMDTHAARAQAYRAGTISYNNYTGFHITDVVKGAIGDLAFALPFFGKGIGAGASTLLGLEEGTAASAFVGGTAGGFSAGFFAASATDATSYIASKLSGSDAERRFQEAQIGGPLSWVESGAWGGLIAGPAGALSKLMPKPVRATRSPAGGTPAEGNEPTVSTSSEPAQTIDPTAGERTVRQGHLSLSYTSDGTVIATVEGQPDVAVVVRNGETVLYTRRPPGYAGATAEGLGENFMYEFHPEQPAPDVTYSRGGASPPAAPAPKSATPRVATNLPTAEEAPFMGTSPSDWDVLNLADELEVSALSEPGGSPMSPRIVWEPPPLAAPRPPLNAARAVRLQWLQQRLQVHIDQAIERYRTEGLTTRQEAALLNRPQMQSAFRGSRIDQFAKDSIMQDPELAELITAPDFFAEPDILDSILPDWFDVTTRAQWLQHLQTYGARYSASGHLLPTN